jgi:hypothetical protein
VRVRSSRLRDQLGHAVLSFGIKKWIVQVLCLLRIGVVNNYSRDAIGGTCAISTDDGRPHAPSCAYQRMGRTHLGVPLLLGSERSLVLGARASPVCKET